MQMLATVHPREKIILNPVHRPDHKESQRYLHLFWSKDNGGLRHANEESMFGTPGALLTDGDCYEIARRMGDASHPYVTRDQIALGVPIPFDVWNGLYAPCPAPREGPRKVCLNEVTKRNLLVAKKK